METGKLVRCKILLLVAMISLALPATLQAQFTYTTNKGAITITGYTGSGGYVTIPSSTNGYPVTSIRAFAFQNKTTVTGVIIPDSVTSIGYQAFYSCSSLTNVVIGNNVTNIPQDAFGYCANLNSVTIPNSVTSIGSWAFEECTNLTSMMIGTGLASIAGGAFRDCSNLARLTVGTTNIPPVAFGNLIGLTQVTICDSVITIGDSAFAGSGLRSVTIPDSVTSIGGAAFDSCIRLTNVVIGTGVTNIGVSAFRGTSLTSVTFGAANIPQGVFAGLTTLTNVSIANGVISIGNSAFYLCSLNSVTIPSSVTNIETNAFAFCSDLESVFFQGNAPPDNGTTFAGNPWAIVLYLPGTTGWGATFGSRPTMPWPLPFPTILSCVNGNTNLGTQNNQYGFTISWATNVPVVIEASTNLANAVWTPLITNTLVNGTNYFSDSEWTNYPSRFYRVRSP